ncbi:MAG: hypothetical protein UZ01_00134, partial [Candidatus Brocadia sinica]
RRIAVIGGKEPFESRMLSSVEKEITLSA